MPSGVERSELVPKSVFQNSFHSAEGLRSSDSGEQRRPAGTWQTRPLLVPANLMASTMPRETAKTCTLLSAFHDALARSGFEYPKSVILAFEGGSVMHGASVGSDDHDY
jgi:hypothetical protein